MSDDAIVLTNNHIAECGPLPRWAVERPPCSYFGYFENEYHEQWVLVATRERLLLAGGDCGWDTLFEFVRPDWKSVGAWGGGWPADLILNPPERVWLLNCLHAAAEGFGA